MEILYFMEKRIKKSLIILFGSFQFLLFFGCAGEDYYHEEIKGNKKIIVRRYKDKIGTFRSEYTKITVLKVRIDDDSEYHITYKLNGYVYSEHDLKSCEINIKDGYGDSWYGRGEFPKFIISYPSNKIKYFDD